MPRLFLALMVCGLGILGRPVAAQSEQQVLMDLIMTAGRYGLFIQAAEDSDCLSRRYEVLTKEGRRLGATGPMLDGQVMVVPLGAASGLMGAMLTIRSLGCDTEPAALRLVRMGKRSPDLGNSVAVARSGVHDVRFETALPGHQLHSQADIASVVLLRNLAAAAGARPHRFEDRRRCTKSCRAALQRGKDRR